MRLLCFSDLHRDRDAASRLVGCSEEVDLVIGAGDFATKREGLSDTLDVLARITKPAVLVPGNGESADELRAAAAIWPTAHVLHAQGCDIDGVSFWGVGGGIPVTPFGDWSYDFDEGQAEAMLEGCGEGGVLVVHSPPLDTVDMDTTGQTRGSRTIRACVERCRPQLVVCGHIHSDWGKSVILGSSRIVNAGPAGKVIELGRVCHLG